MYIPEELKKENKFVDVKLPANKLYFSRMGSFTPAADSYSGDEPVIMNQDKVQQIEDFKKYAESQNSIDSKND